MEVKVREEIYFILLLIVLFNIVLGIKDFFKVKGGWFLTIEIIIDNLRRSRLFFYNFYLVDVYKIVEIFKKK